MISILYVINDYHDLSINRRILDLVNHLDSNQFAITILVLSPKGRLKKQFQVIKNIHIIHAKGNPIATVFLIKKLLHRHQIQIVHTQTLKPDYLIYFAKLISTAKPLHLSTRGYDFFPIFNPFHLIKNLFYVVSLYLSNHNIPVSNSLFQKFIRTTHLNKKTVHPIHNGVNLSIKPVQSFDLKKQLNISATTVIVIYTGRFIKRKRLLMLLKSLLILKKQNITFHCLLIGYGPEKQPLKRYLIARNLHHDVTFIPFQADIDPYLRQSDIYVLPSGNEGLSNSLLEAMAAKLAVLVSAIPANLELVKHQQNGLAFNSQQQLTKHLIALLDQPDLRSHLGDQAYKTVSQHYSRKQMLDAYRKLYLKLIK